MFEEQFLYQKLDALREFGAIQSVPTFIDDNLRHELREYQRAAIENFIAYFDGKLRQRPTQVLFHMATGSGKTLLMAGLSQFPVHSASADDSRQDARQFFVSSGAEISVCGRALHRRRANCDPIGGEFR